MGFFPLSYVYWDSITKIKSLTIGLEISHSMGVLSWLCVLKHIQAYSCTPSYKLCHPTPNPNSTLSLSVRAWFFYTIACTSFFSYRSCTPYPHTFATSYRSCTPSLYTFATVELPVRAWFFYTIACTSCSSYRSYTPYPRTFAAVE